MKVNIAGKTDYPSHLRMLLTGDHNVGKTFLATKAPNPLFVRCGESNVTTLAAEGCRYVEVESEAELLSLKKALSSSTLEEDFAGPVDTLVIDSLDELQRILLLKKMKADGRATTSRDDWGWIATRLNAIAAGLKSLDMHLIFIVPSKDVSDGDSSVVKPALQGAFVDQIHNYVDVSAIMTVQPMGAEDFGPEVEDLNDLPLPGDRHLFISPRVDAPWCGSKILDGDTIRMSDTLICDIIDSLNEKREAMGDSSSFVVTEEADSPKEIEVPGMSSNEQIAEILQQKKQKTGGNK